jgi:ubiquinone/menaquinone biosynthesis C-methylase UbiE
VPLLTPRRIDEPELLDEHDAPRADVERSLRDLRRFNRYLGGIRIYRRVLARLLVERGAGTPLVLDVGAGSTDTVDAVAARDGIRTVALDFKMDHLLYDRKRSSARRVVGDARALPFRDNSADVVTSAHFFHHFSPDENTVILSESLRVARIGVGVNDTRRHYAPLVFTQLLAWLRLVGRITRSDAPGSIRRGYTIEEARNVAARVPAARSAIITLFPFRFGILLWKR